MLTETPVCGRGRAKSARSASTSGPRKRKRCSNLPQDHVRAGSARSEGDAAVGIVEYVAFSEVGGVSALKISCADIESAVREIPPKRNEDTGATHPCMRSVVLVGRRQSVG